MNFDVKNYPGKYVMHCKTKAEAREFLKYLDNIGRCWSSGNSYATHMCWVSYGDKTAYSFNEGTFANIQYYINNGYKILEWSDFNESKPKEKPVATITDSERKYLLKEMKKLLDEYDYVYTEPALNKIIDEWARNKATLINAFREHPNYVDGKFMIVFEKSYIRKMNIQSVREFSRYLLNTVAVNLVQSLPEPINIRRIRDYSDYLPDDLWCFFRDLGDYRERTISSEFYNYLYHIIPEIPVHVGEKTTRIINKICKYLGYDKHEDYNKRFAEFSDSMSPTTIKRTCVLSINPLDYLTMSFGNSWSSCHTIDKNNRRGMPNSYEGRYSSGTMSYLLDEPSMVFYTVNKEKDIDSHVKIERQMFHYCDNTLVQGRLYPQDNDSGSKEIYNEYRSAVQGILSEMFGMDEWECEEGTDTIDDYVGSDGTHYRDYKNFENCTISWSGRREPAPMLIGHDPICIDCGRTHYEERNISCCGRMWVTCADCGRRMIHNDAITYYDGNYYCNNCVVECPTCGRNVPRSMKLTIDGAEYCNHCLSLNFTVCNDCRQFVRRNETHHISNFHDVCSSCFERNYTTCPECGRVYRNGSIHVCPTRFIVTNDGVRFENARYVSDVAVGLTFYDGVIGAEGVTNGEI